MYDFIDRPVTTLDRGGRFLVWSMRSWVAAMGEKRCPVGAIAQAFRAWNMLPALVPFVRMMELFNRHGRDNFQFCALSCNHVSEHEAIIISLVCALRGQAPNQLHRVLDLLVGEEATEELVQSISSLGGRMEAASIFPMPPQLPGHSGGSDADGHQLPPSASDWS